MKKQLLLLFTLLISGLLHAQQTITVDGVKYKYTKEERKLTKVSFDNGIVLDIEGSNAVSAVTAALKRYLANNPPVQPPAATIEITWPEFCDLHDVQDKSYVIKPGTYNQTAYPYNLKNVKVTGLGKVTIKNTYMAVQLGGLIDNVTIDGLNFKDVDGYQINMYGVSKIQYNGSAGSFINGLNISNLNVDGGGQVFHADGDLISGKVWGLLKGFKLTNASIKNVSYGDMIYIGAGMDAEFSNVTFDNINASQNNHNGVIRVHGNMIAKNVRATNYQGNLFRNWLYSIEGVKTTSISNSIGYRSRKYSLIELQMTPDLAANGAKPGNAEIFNNTAISMATSKDWDGQLIDIYNTGGKINIYNNLGADLIASQSRSIIPGEIANKMFDARTEVRFSGNMYFQSVADAVENTTTFKSKFQGIGAQ